MKVEDSTKPSLMSTNKSNDQPDSDSTDTLYKDCFQEMVTVCCNQLSHDDKVHAALPFMKEYG